jgi:methylase of polypeptide subunit release factors
MPGLPIYTLVVLFSQTFGGTPQLAPFYATPQVIVERMLDLGHLQAGEKMCDLGSGDGRIVITAAQKFNADATGIEIDDKLFRQSNTRIHELGLARTARIVHGDILKQRYSSYDLVTVYLDQPSNDVLQPVLERELKKGARVVSHDYEFHGWRPTEMVTVEGDEPGKNHVLYLYER